MRVAPALTTAARVSWRSVLLAVVVVATAMVGLALLVEAVSGGTGGAVYLANIQPGSGAMTSRPSILVTGIGRAKAPAETALLQLMVGVDESSNVSGRTPLDPDTTAVEKAQAVLQPMIDAIVATGVERAAIRTVASEAFASVFCNSPGCDAPIRLDITVNQPSQILLNAIVDAAGLGVQGTGFRLQQVGAAYLVADCLGLQRQARALAIVDAKRRASEQAGALGVQLGELIVSSESTSSESFDDRGCPIPAPPAGSDLFGVAAAAMTTPRFDPIGSPETVILVEVSLAYAMRESPSD